MKQLSTELWNKVEPLLQRGDSASEAVELVLQQLRTSGMADSEIVQVERTMQDWLADYEEPHEAERQKTRESEGR